jgi:hypothetical protein
MTKRISLVAGLAAAALAVASPVAAQVEVEVEAQVARGVVERMPSEAGTTFPADVGTVFCWTRVSGAEGTTLQHVWIHGDQQFPVPVQIGGSPWRTWTSKVIPPEWAGEWSVEIRDGNGAVLQTVSFTVGT